MDLKGMEDRFVPKVSVVMSVYNGGETLEATVQSVMAQEKVSFEFIIVDDGSTDTSFDLVQVLAEEDSRIRLFHQENAGLTKALIQGCLAARGEFIARQDVGDISLPGRLATQLMYLQQHPEVVLVSCGNRQVAPDGELLLENLCLDTAQNATDKIRNIDFSIVRGISHHGTAMFRRSAYEKAGGYRHQFYYAQDLDLWRRITDFGLLAFVPEILYEAIWNEGSISASCYNEQRHLKRIIIELSNLRSKGLEEAALLSQAELIRPSSTDVSKKKGQAGNGYYFIGRLLQQRNDPRARKYLLRALNENHFHWRALFALFFGRLRQRK